MRVSGQRITRTGSDPRLGCPIGPPDPWTHTQMRVHTRITDDQGHLLLHYYTILLIHNRVMVTQCQLMLYTVPTSI
jgi:hypothetical protein